MKHKYPIYFKNFSEKNYINNCLNRYGVAVMKKLIDKKTMLKVKTKATKFLNQPRMLSAASCVYPKYSDIYKKNPNNLKTPNWLPKKYMNIFERGELKQPTGEMSKQVDRKELKKGYKHYKNLTNSIEVIDSLINFPEIIKIVFNENGIEVAENFLKSKAYLGYVALRCHFNNNLPVNDFNLMHTDGRTKVTRPSNKLLKILVPFHLKNREQIEFGQMLLKRNKFKNKDYYRLQYTKLSEWPRKLRKLFIRPKVLSRDAYFIDPDDFFHNAAKPKKLRIMLYIVYIKSGSYMTSKTKKVRMKKSSFNKLSNKQKSFGKYITLV